MSYEDAYAIHLKTYDIKTRFGVVVVGKKIGFTSKAMQLQLNVTEPDFGGVHIESTERRHEHGHADGTQPGTTAAD